MTQESSVFIHLGLPKTASTYLQRVVFPQLDNITFHKKHDFKKYRNIKVQPGEKHLFSSEMDRGIEDEMRRIKELHPSASIILVFRSHFSWILSKYKYSIRKWNHLPMAEYYSTEGDKVLQVPDDYYRQIIQLADTLFNGRVLVINYHHLRSNPGHVERLLQEFMGLPVKEIMPGKTVNKAFNTRQLVHLRRYNQRHRYYESGSGIRFFKKLHYRYRQYLLHTVAFFARFIPANEKAFQAELQHEKEVIEELYKNDWSFIEERTAILRDGM